MGQTITCKMGLGDTSDQLLLLRSYSAQLQHDEDFDTFSASWVILMFPWSTKLCNGLQDL